MGSILHMHSCYDYLAFVQLPLMALSRFRFIVSRETLISQLGIATDAEQEQSTDWVDRKLSLISAVYNQIALRSRLPLSLNVTNIS